MKVHLFIFVFVGLHLACHDTGPELNTSILINCWHHAYEEDPHNRLQLYRPCDHWLPDTEIRFTFILYENNDAEYLVYADDDGNYLTFGQWHYNPENRHLTIRNASGLPVRRFRVESTSQDAIHLWLIDDYY